jgi:hypothetical protein
MAMPLVVCTLWIGASFIAEEWELEALARMVEESEAGWVVALDGQSRPSEDNRIDVRMHWLIVPTKSDDQLRTYIEEVESRGRTRYPGFKATIRNLGPVTDDGISQALGPGEPHRSLYLLRLHYRRDPRKWRFTLLDW